MRFEHFYCSQQFRCIGFWYFSAAMRKEGSIENRFQWHGSAAWASKRWFSAEDNNTTFLAPVVLALSGIEIDLMWILLKWSCSAKGLRLCMVASKLHFCQGAPIQHSWSLSFCRGCEAVSITILVVSIYATWKTQRNYLGNLHDSRF